MSDEENFRLKVQPRKSRSQSAEVHIPANYKGFYQEARIALVRGKAVSGRRTLTKPSNRAPGALTPEAEVVRPWSAALGRNKVGEFTARQVGVVTALEHSPRDGRALAWQVPEDFESKAIALDMKQGRASGVKLLSRLDLDVQLASPGATWLDRAQVDYGKGGIERISAKTSIFAKELDTVFQQRREWLIEQGYAELRQEEHKTSVIYKRGYIKALEVEGFNAATEKLEGMTGKAHVAAQAGRLIEGTVAQKFELTHGPHVMIETQRAFYLVPWESQHGQKWGKRIKGRVLSVGGIDWDTGRTRGIER